MMENTLFHVDNLSLIMLSLIGFVAATVAIFSWRYLKGDRACRAFFFKLLLQVGAVWVLVCADHMLVFLCAWVLSNVVLTRLMLHKRDWQAARQSALLAYKNFSIGSIFLGLTLGLLFWVTGQVSIQGVLNTAMSVPVVLTSGLLIMLSAMSQSALWPFHRFLTSSLNSPTPVSALMHAGLINGGGFLLARFAPLISQSSSVLTGLFVVGVITALLGTLWKLMQSDVKRMLACSTMGQMGFMVAQCGLGLFSAAVVHLSWHGLFKAYLFLSSGSVVQEKRFDLDYPPALKHFFLALVCGVLGALMFAIASGKSVLAKDTTFFLVMMALISGTQFALPIVRGQTRAKLPVAVCVTAVMGALYGLSVHLMSHLLAPLGMASPQPLNILHGLAIVAFTLSWLGIVFHARSQQGMYPQWVLKAYVHMLNASQPHPKTVTAHRNQYQY